MNSKELGRTILMVAVIGILILVAVDTRATAQEGGDETIGHGEAEQSTEALRAAVPGGPGLISIHPSEFVQRSTTGKLTYADSDEIYNSLTTGILGVHAPVNLPHGAIVNKFTFYYYDAYADGIIRAYLSAVPLSGGGYIDLAVVASDTNTGYGNVSDSTIANKTIDNANYTYTIDVWFDYQSALTQLRVTGFRIDYEYPTYLPTIMK